MQRKLVVLVTLLFVVTIPAFCEFFVIDSYHIEIDVSRANRYEIVETIEVSYSEPRHGIYRDIPNRYYEKPVLIENIEVPGHTFALMRQSGNLRIRIGDAEEYVEGTQRYIIRYDYQVSNDPYNDMDEFYFNLIGDAWETTIDGVTFTISMPDAFDPDDISFTYGPFGSTEKAPVQFSVTGTTIAGALTTTLGPREALTIALPLPEGYFAEAESIEYPARAHLRSLEIPVDLILIILAALFWFLWGRDNKLTTVVEYRAPEGLTPAEIGYIIDGTVDAKDITSLIIYLAEKGYLEIDVEDKGLFNSKMTLSRLKEMSSEEPEFVQDLFRALFETYGTDGVVTTKDLKNKFYVTMAKLQKAVKKSFTSDPERRIFERPKWYVSLVLFLGGVFVTVKTLYPVLYELIYDPVFAGIASGVLSIICFAGLSMVASAFGKQQGFSAGTDIPKLIFGPILGLGPYAAVYFVAGSVYANPLFFMLSAVTLFVVALFSHLMTRRTPNGDRMVERVLGLREFIRSAEKDRIDVLFKENPSYFYDVLPYAIVLGASNAWAEHFEGLSVEPPNWYRSSTRTAFSVAAFQHDLDRQLTTLNSSMSSSPSSSSSSSGGSSGGGAGGGGGGSW